MTNKAAFKYADSDNLTSVLAADARELIVLIHERIFDHLNIAKKALEKNEMPVDSFVKAGDLILKGLLGCLDYEKGKEIAQNLSLIYIWSLQELICARAEHSASRVQDVINTLNPLYEAWVELSDRV
jgi:flagellar protein FliS